MMKIVSLVFLLGLTSFVYVSADILDLKELKFVLYGKHGEGDATSVASGKCPLGKLPESVFLHKTFKKGDHFFTWVKPVHGKVNEIKCGSHEIWKANGHEILMDLHFFGSPNAKKFVHLELLHHLGGLVHVFLLFDGSAPAKAIGMAKFIIGINELMPDVHKLEGIPAHHLISELALIADAQLS